MMDHSGIPVGGAGRLPQTVQGGRYCPWIRGH